VPLRVFLSGRASAELDALRRRLLADSNLEIVDRAELAEAVVSLPRLRSPAGDEASDEDVVLEELTERERDVLALAGEGLSNRDIANALAISEHTVKFHLASVFGKLGASTRTEAVHRGLRLGLIEL
jgi:ATP/maltotriose-dependent transcriptional regulator MalT